MILKNGNGNRIYIKEIDFRFFPSKHHLVILNINPVIGLCLYILVNFPLRVERFFLLFWYVFIILLLMLCHKISIWLLVWAYLKLGSSLRNIYLHLVPKLLKSNLGLLRAHWLIVNKKNELFISKCLPQMPTLHRLYAEANCLYLWKVLCKPCKYKKNINATCRFTICFYLIWINFGLCTFHKPCLKIVFFLN